MGKQKIRITQEFKAPVEEIFNLLTDHETFGRIVGANITRVIDSPEQNPNGTGSVRQIAAFPGIRFEETVVTFEQNHLMEYVISKGSPIKNHRGCFAFSKGRDTTWVDYTISFEPRLPFFFLGPVLRRVIGAPLKKGIVQLADQIEQRGV